MVQKRISLSVDSKTYDKYIKYCKENGIVVSKKVELFMKKEMEGKK